MGRSPPDRIASSIIRPGPEVVSHGKATLLEEPRSDPVWLREESSISICMSRRVGIGFAYIEAMLQRESFNRRALRSPDMMILRTPHPRKLALFAFLSLADLGLTLELIRRSNGRVYESNPIADAWLASYGSSGLALFKILAVLIVAVSAVLVSRHRPRVGARLLSLACGATGLVVAYSVLLLGENGRARGPQGVAAQQTAQPMQPRWIEEPGPGAGAGITFVMDR